MHEHEETRLVRVERIEECASDVRLYTLTPADGRPLPPTSAGAHIDVQLADTMVRQYSVVAQVPSSSAYQIAVKREAQGRGGSQTLHDSIEEGFTLGIVGPRNNFPLNEDAKETLFIAGGIGVTPIVAMAHRLADLGRSWSLHYCARSEEHAAFYGDLQALNGGAVHHYFSEAPLLDVASLLAQPQADCHVYCCGPEGLMRAVQEATQHWPEAQVHFEWFARPEQDWPENEAFEVHLARSGMTLHVPADETILSVLRKNGFSVPYSCQEGLCGACETAVVEGVPQHRDTLLSPSEQTAGKTMMICVSRANTSRLVLDL